MRKMDILSMVFTIVSKVVTIVLQLNGFFEIGLVVSALSTIVGFEIMTINNRMKLIDTISVLAKETI